MERLKLGKLSKAQIKKCKEIIKKMPSLKGRVIVPIYSDWDCGVEPAEALICGLKSNRRYRGEK